MAKPPIRAALTAASGPAPLVTGRHPCAPVRGAGPRVADRVDTQPQPRSIRPAASRNTAARRVRRKPGVDYLRRLAGTTERPICGIADPASIEPDPAPIGSVRPVRLNAGHIAGLRRRSGPRSAYGSVAPRGRQQDLARHAAARPPTRPPPACRSLTTSTRPFCGPDIMIVRRCEGLWRFGAVSTATSLTLPVWTAGRLTQFRSQRDCGCCGPSSDLARSSWRVG